MQRHPHTHNSKSRVGKVPSPCACLSPSVVGRSHTRTRWMFLAEDLIAAERQQVEAESGKKVCCNNKVVGGTVRLLCPVVVWRHKTKCTVRCCSVRSLSMEALLLFVLSCILHTGFSFSVALPKNTILWRYFTVHFISPVPFSSFEVVVIFVFCAFCAWGGKRVSRFWVVVCYDSMSRILTIALIHGNSKNNNIYIYIYIWEWRLTVLFQRIMHITVLV
ncbi:hypothetical protein TPHA_0O01840 [Tetrapisispora phaffii CBS 4417]|uniref:Uncharacterized protein n=1 Tax=Tetrapisispora phaffii (strain ATCC 24235 / CBS 4417 / NBRC 1672 / NRRL Y-8282 / UCD 70-5) TaxID=1071381 RepID=G8C1X3_TETPH|nr:hypothetical protein TPHA_0O01840 [Tetrapisispora phaffii CBS 4417]CCE66151.1 hypothetical protein TPHA_0O01840 [Tetrapisispora phaffii CBS 4417]